MYLYKKSESYGFKRFQLVWKKHYFNIFLFLNLIRRNVYKWSYKREKQIHIESFSNFIVSL